MKKKIIISILIVVLLIFGLWKLIHFIYNKNLVNVGNELYGTDKCECNFDNEIVGMAFTSWTCELCGFSSVLNNTGVPKLCSSCSEITNRCFKCGKIN